ncbi:hypothetical protein [Aeromicrobium sp. Leaf350]|uniref:hypothetical protein n=1 Tax=Aeromicrobium sp. Leaf350 TaxID=2876565 RepID=UPI001E3B8D49|nr:hypothetical protein [Aeromicrobium sp. Leaf350]
MTPTPLTREERALELAALNRVRRRVAAIGFLAIIGHGVIALPIVAHHLVDDGRTSDAVILLVLTVFVTTVAIVVSRLILGRKPMTFAWALVPVAVPLVAALWIWG